MMMACITYLRARFGSKKGQGMVEYGLILAALAVIVIVCVTALQTPLKAFFEGIGDFMKDSTPTVTP
jgi:pilus assembly protein Flp/PilA